MPEGKHTPGPWKAHHEWANSYGVPIYAVDRNERDVRDHIGNAYGKADARLFAKSPDLLGLAYSAMVELEAIQRHGELPESAANLIEDLHAAIDYIEGREP